MGRQINVACLQTEPMPDTESALVQALALARNAVSAGAQLLVLPEYCGGLQTQGSSFAPPVQDEDSHPVLNGLRQFAQDNSVWILIGSIAVPGSNGKSNSKYHNRSFMIGDKGEIIGRYDKINLFDVALSDDDVYRESDTVEAGDKLIIIDLPFARIGLSICYDLRFPQLYRQLAQAGAEILMVPAAFTAKTGALHWHVLNRARAIENGAFVVAPCAIGDVTGGGRSYGHSLIIHPSGEVISDAGDKPGIISSIIDLDHVKQARDRIPSWQKDAKCSLSSIKNQAVS
ncbi:MAG: carbon-nitrogen hydrolase family protein [Granulosicoccaceae bacterium]